MVTEMLTTFIFNIRFWNTGDEVSMEFTLVNSSTFSSIKLGSDGLYQRYTDPCDNYGRCGPNSNCDVYTGAGFECTCLAGFEPKSQRDWSLRDGSGGCVRIRGTNTCRSGEGFIKIAGVKPPDASTARVNESLNLEGCKKECLNDCNCRAYTGANVSAGASGCLSWYGDLMDIRTLAQGGQDLFVRVDAIILAENERKKTFFHKKRMIVILAVGVVFLMIPTICSSWLIMKKRKATRLKHYSKAKEIDENGENPKLQFFDLNCNETKKSMLTWRKRFEIIIGIARGILYLHQDSRLRIIHRDLKASNILLDIDMIPKFSDFGMARLFGKNQIEGSTKRVVGTYGYMSPKYAMEGLFSIKSDVYSFGVLLLEIIIRRRNIAYYYDSPSFNLVRYVWSLWKEGKALDIVDPSLEKSNHANEVLRCVQIGLLCVQDSAIDRPTMLTIIFMLGNNSTLPPPNQPAFVMKTCHNGANSFSVVVNSVNDVTISMDAR
ncbi:hypothetical protein PVL29_012716 [Vitis rotundifolia]|uniref:Uncharacterized protein n=1 Tax=Vitis rotundifolia TaxID=103349 RepID=A0AA38ZJQ2_VITRO|nr:hypothetical protein PVL29_012716 [Vitis rotundifolia]